MSIKKNKNFYLSHNRDRLLEELEYETKNLGILKKMKRTPIIDAEIKQTEHTLERIKSRLSPSAESGTQNKKWTHFILVGSKTNLLPDMEERYDAIVDGEKRKYFDKKTGEHFATLVKQGRFLEIYHDGTLNEYGWRKTPSAESGVLVGKTDIAGREGMPALMPDGRILKVGGGEIIMNERASTDNCKELSKMNVEGGGIAFDCDLQKVANTDRASGKMPKDEWHQESASSGIQTHDENVSEIIKILSENKFYSNRNLGFSQLAVFVNLVIKEYLVYDKNNPIITRFNEAVYFEPSEIHIKREGILKAKIEYASHFITGSVNGKRAFDKSKMDALQFLIPVLKSPDVQRLEQKPDSSKNRQKATIYAKEISIGSGFCVILVAEINKNGIIRAITFIPKNKCGYIEKQKAANIWLDASAILPPPYEKPPFEGSRTENSAGGGNILHSNSKDTTKNAPICKKLYNTDNQIVAVYHEGDSVEVLYNEYSAASGTQIPPRYKNMGFTHVGHMMESTQPEKKWMVLAKKGDQYKVVHGGQKGMEDFSQHKDEARRRRFWERMGGEDSEYTRDPFSPLYWHKKYGTWAGGGQNAASGIQINKNPTKDELRDVLSGKSQDSAGKAIRAIVAHIEGNRSTGEISGRDGESKKEQSLSSNEAATGLKTNQNISKHEIELIASGIHKVINGEPILAAASYLRRGKSAIIVAEKPKPQEAEILRKYKPLIPSSILRNRFDGGTEQNVYLSDSQTVLKTNDCYFYNSWEDYFTNLLLHNCFFPATAYKLLGFTDDNGKLRAVVKQQYIKTEKEINDMDLVHDWLINIGFKNIRNDDYYSSELGVTLEDLHEQNVITRNGFIYFIDTVFYMGTGKSASEGRKIHGFDKAQERSREYVLLVLRLQNAPTDADLRDIEFQMNADHAAGLITDADKAWLTYQIKLKQHSAEAGIKNENMKKPYTIKEWAEMLLEFYHENDIDYSKHETEQFEQDLLASPYELDSKNAYDIAVQVEDYIKKNKSASSGTKTPTPTNNKTPMNLYYLKPGNKIQEHHNGAIAYTYEIRSFKKTPSITIPGSEMGTYGGTYVAMVKEHSITPGRIAPEFEIRLDDIMSHMENKHYTIEGCTFETDRDKILLQTEISGIINEEQGKELEAILQDTKLRAAQAEENLGSTKARHEAHKAATDDTIAGMEAMAGGGQGDKLPAKAEKFLSKFPDNATSWAQATDEIRDMARTAKEYYNGITLDVLSEDPKGLKPLDFKKLKTPSQWNTQGKKYIRDTYKKMNADARQQFLDRFSDWFGSDSAASGKQTPLSFDEWMEEQKEDGEHNLPSVGYKNYLKLFHAEHGTRNNYKGKSVAQVWNEWTPDQRMHFMNDHINKFREHLPISKWKNEEWSHVPSPIQKAVKEHIEEGSYAGGKGTIKRSIRDIVEEYKATIEKYYADGIKNFKDDKEMEDMFKSDKEDHFEVIDDMEKGHWKSAYTTWMRMDTASREQIPDHAYELLMNKNGMDSYAGGKGTKVGNPLTVTATTDIMEIEDAKKVGMGHIHLLKEGEEIIVRGDGIPKKFKRKGKDLIFVDRVAAKGAKIPDAHPKHALSPIPTDMRYFLNQVASHKSINGSWAAKLLRADKMTVSDVEKAYTLGFENASKGAKVGKIKEWLVEDEDGKRRVVESNTKPKKGDNKTTVEWEGVKSIVVSKVIGKAPSASSGTQIKKTTKKKNFYHIRFRVPRGVETCRVPEYGKTIASTIHDGSKITMCKFNGEYKLQKVMVPVKGVSKSEAENIAKKVASKLEPNK